MSKTFARLALTAALLGLLSPLPAPAAEPIAVSGRVVGPRDQPVAGAAITLHALESELERGRRWLAQETDPPPLAKAQTDAAGAFRLTVAEPVLAVITVRAAGFAAVEAPLEPLLESIELPVAQLARSRELSVRVTGAGGKPSAGAWIAVTTLGRERTPFPSGWRGARRWGRAGADGTLRVERGEEEAVLVRALAPGTGEIERDVVRDSTLALQLPAASPFPIQLRGPGGRPVAGAVLFGGKGSWPLALSDASGKLEVAAPLAASVVTARAPDGAYLEARPPRPPQPGTPVVLDLPAPVRLAGRVVEAGTRRPIANAFVWPHGAADLAVRSRGDGGYEVTLAAAHPRLHAVAAGFLGADSWQVGAGVTRGPTFALAATLVVGGMVVDEGGRPVAGAEIEPQADLVPRMGRSWLVQPRRARSRNDGGFELRGLEAGSRYGLRVSHDDFAPTTLELPPTDLARPWPPQRVVMSRGVGAFGRILTGERQPVAGATVELVAAPESRGRMRMSFPESEGRPFTASSGADGRFSVEHVPVGRYNVEVEARGFAPVTVPGVELAATPPRRDLGTVVVGPGAVLEGVVVDPDGLALAEARLWAMVPGSEAAMRAIFNRVEDEPQAVTGADGRFRIESLRPGQRIDVVARRHGYSRGELAGVDPPVAEPLRIVLSPAVRVSGRVVDLDGKGIVGAFVDHSVKIVRGNMVGWTHNGKQKVTTGAEGRFAIEGVEPGTISLFAGAPGFAAGSRDELAVVAGRDLEGVEILLRPGARVSGRVLDASGEPVDQVQVMVENSMRQTMMMPPLTMSDGDGLYSIEGVEPGPQTVVARHDDGRRAAAELEVRDGDNALDLRLAGGVEVTGVVRDSDGLPLGGARVHLITAGRFWRPRETTSLADGSFRLTDVLDGAYQLRGESEGYAAAELPVQVAAEPVGGLLLRMDRGGSIVGQVRGLEFGELSQVRLYGWSGRMNSRSGALDFEGRYRLVNLRPGTWTVQAQLTDGGRSARGEVVLAEGQSEATLDLEFGEGWVLSGRVSKGGQPVAGAIVIVRGRDVVGGGEATTGQAGDFRIQDLKSGAFALTVNTAQGFVHGEEVALTADRELEIALSAGEVRGVVLDSVDRAPIAGAVVSLDMPPGTDQTLRFGRTRVTETDSRGAFRISEVATGTWSVAAERSGYARADKIAVVGTGTDVEDIELELQPTEGVSLEVRGSGGRVPEMVVASVIDPTGRRVAGGTYTPTDTGRVRLRDVPAGNWEVVLSADDNAAAQIQVVVPGPAVPVVLAPGATLDLVVPELAESPVLARASLADPAGRPFRVPDWSSGTRSEWPMRAGRVQIRNLPAGAWTVTVVAPDGRSWSGTATAAAGATSELKLETPAPR